MANHGGIARWVALCLGRRLMAGLCIEMGVPSRLPQSSKMGLVLADDGSSASLNTKRDWRRRKKHCRRKLVSARMPDGKGPSSAQWNQHLAPVQQLPCDARKPLATGWRPPEPTISSRPNPSSIYLPFPRTFMRTATSRSLLDFHTRHQSKPVQKLQTACSVQSQI